MKRLFIAIKIKPKSNFLKIFDELKQGLKHEKIKWVENNNLHLTLKFLGETSEEKTPEIIGALEEALKFHNSFCVDIRTIGLFGSHYDPKLIWAGLQNSESLIQLAADVNTGLEKIGSIQDRQNFVPHLSLGRIKYLSDKNLFQDIISEYKNEFFQKVFVNEVYLFESNLTKEGPIYKVVEKFELN